MGTQLEIVADGRWLSMEDFIGDVTMSTVWPGGSEELSWTPSGRGAHRFEGGEKVIAYYGGVGVWAGALNEPDPSQEQMSAKGAWYEGQNFSALDGSGNATTDVNTAIDQAISRGLRWTRPSTFVPNPTVDYDISQGPLTVASLLDAWALSEGERWLVDGFRQVVYQVDDTSPTYMFLPIEDGLGYALDNYAATLIGRYKIASGYATQTATDTVAAGIHGTVEDVVDLTPRGVITASRAGAILTKMLARDRSTPQWTSSIEAVYGEVLNPGGVPVALETVEAGHIIRVMGDAQLAQRGNAALYVDFLIGRTSLSDGTITIEPIQQSPRNFTGVMTQVLSASQINPASRSPQPSAAPTSFGARQRTSQQSIPNNTVTTASWGSVKEAAVGGVTWDTGNDRWSINQAGTYHVMVSILWDPNTTGRRNVHLLLNGADYAIGEKAGNALSTGSPTLEVACDVPCQAGDTLQVQVFQNSGAALNIGPASADGTRHFFSVRA